MSNPSRSKCDMTRMQQAGEDILLILKSKGLALTSEIFLISTLPLSKNFLFLGELEA